MDFHDSTPKNNIGEALFGRGPVDAQEGEPIPGTGAVSLCFRLSKIFLPLG
jgi:hypothetical protein